MEPDFFLTDGNLVEAFDYEGFSAIKLVPDRNHYEDMPYFSFSTSMFVMQPSQQIFKDMLRRVPYCPWVDKAGKVSRHRRCF